MPSTGTRSPGRTTISSPTATWSSGTSASTPPRFTRAVAGASFNSASTALPVAKRLRISIQWPARLKEVSMAAAS